MRLIPLKAPGEIKEGDYIYFEFKGVPEIKKAAIIINASTQKEEVIIDVPGNKYFITSMAVDGTSWAKNVAILDKDFNQ